MSILQTHRQTESDYILVNSTAFCGQFNSALFHVFCGFYCTWVPVDLGYDMTWVRLDRGYQLTWVRVDRGYERTWVRVDCIPLSVSSLILLFMTRRVVAATHESESDRARVRFSDLLMCADLTDLRSTNLPTISVDHGHVSLKFRN